MAILKFDQTPWQAIRAGFLKGLLAPAHLFDTEGHPPVPPAPLPIVPPSRSTREALAADWKAVGQDLAAVMGREYGEGSSPGLRGDHPGDADGTSGRGSSRFSRGR